MNNAQYLIEIDRASYQYTLQSWPDAHPDSPLAKDSRTEWRAAIAWRDQRPDPEKEELIQIANLLVGNPNVDHKIRIRLKNVLIKINKPS